MNDFRKDLKNIINGFNGQINDHENRMKLDAELNKVLFTALGTDVFTFKSTGCGTEVFIDLYYKGQEITKTGYLAEIVREMEHEDDPFLAKGQYLDNLASIYNKHRNNGETDKDFRNRIFRELKEESEE